MNVNSPGVCNPHSLPSDRRDDVVACRSNVERGFYAEADDPVCRCLSYSSAYAILKEAHENVEECLMCVSEDRFY